MDALDWIAVALIAGPLALLTVDWWRQHRAISRDRRRDPWVLDWRDWDTEDE